MNSYHWVSGFILRQSCIWLKIVCATFQRSLLSILCGWGFGPMGVNFVSLECFCEPGRMRGSRP